MAFRLAWNTEMLINLPGAPLIGRVCFNYKGINAERCEQLMDRMVFASDVTSYSSCIRDIF